MKIITLQPSPRVDQITEDGRELTQLPYPFHVAESGDIDRQDFWRGSPLEVLGFANRLDVQRVDLWWDDALGDPQQAVGKYIVTQDADGTIGTHECAVSRVEVHELGAAQ